MGNNLVTVAIPAYNHQDYVQQTIRSIIEQTHPNIELIILNDGSTDETDSKIREILPECQKRFARLAYVNKANEGLAATWNRAIDWATADLFYSIASDDIALPHAIETLYHFLSNNPDYALVVGDNQIINKKGQRCYWDEQRNNTTLENAVYRTFAECLKKKRKNRSRFKPKNYGSYKTLIRGDYITNGKMFRTQSLINVGKYIPGLKLEDWYMNLQLAKYYKMKFIDEVLLSYRWHDTNTIRNEDYINGSKMAIFQYENEHHPQWFKKYASRKIKALIREPKG